MVISIKTLQSAFPWAPCRGRHGRADEPFCGHWGPRKAGSLLLGSSWSLSDRARKGLVSPHRNRQCQQEPGTFRNDPSPRSGHCSKRCCSKAQSTWRDQTCLQPSLRVSRPGGGGAGKGRVSLSQVRPCAWTDGDSRGHRPAHLAKCVATGMMVGGLQAHGKGRARGCPPGASRAVVHMCLRHGDVLCIRHRHCGCTRSQLMT